MFITKKSDNLTKVFLRTIIFLFTILVLGLWLDSKFFEFHLFEKQWIPNFLIIILFAVLYRRATKKVKEFLIYAIIIAIIGECFFSLLLEMYTYRLHNVPIYVFFGHAILFATVFYFCKASAVKLHKKKFENIFTAIAIVYATAFLLIVNDVWGFILTGLTLTILIFKPRERLFYLTMYICVAFLEIIGTWYQCWFWPPYALNIESKFLSSYNPPTGISFFYFGLDLGCLFLYKLRHKVAWKRMKNIRKLRLLNS